MEVQRFFAGAAGPAALARVAVAWLAGLSLALPLAACGGGGGSGGGSTPPPGGGDPPAVPTPTLSLPRAGITASELAVVILQGDALSEAVGTHYQQARGIPAANVVRVSRSGSGDNISAAEFQTLKTAIEAQLPAGVQALLLTWRQPSRVVGTCSMSITSALAFGYDAAWCTPGCNRTRVSPYFNSETTRPAQDLALRPAMMLGAATLAEAQALTARGLAADGSQPAGTGYLLRTTDTARSVRHTDWVDLPALWNGGLALNYVDNSSGNAAGNTLTNTDGVLFYFTGLTSVSGLATNRYRPGAIGDHLTSTGGVLGGGGGQMPATAWLEAGLTASYGTVEEPCNFTEKFPQVSVLLNHYFRGATLIEAYWKSVQWPGQGLFLGEPLARPFTDLASFAISGGQYSFSTRALRPLGRYTLQYRVGSTGSWTTLASFTGPTRAQPQSLSAPLPPSTATELRWQGPCPADAAQTCTLASSGGS